MPYIFKYRTTSNKNWCAKLKCGRGKYCNKVTTIPYDICLKHTTKYNLLIKRTSLINPSTGRRYNFDGLYAYSPKHHKTNTPVFRRYEKICTYVGEPLTEKQLIKRYPCSQSTAPYVVRKNKNSYFDAALQRGIASFTNTKPNHNNATLRDNRYEVFMKATKHIYHLDEIFVFYGRGYDFTSCRHSTVKVA